MVTDHQRKLIWEGLLGADFRSRYYGALASRFERTERWIGIVLGIFSSGALLAIVIQSNVPYLKEGLALVAAFLSWISIAHKFSKAASLSASLHKKWSQIRLEYESLWGQVDQLDPEKAEATWRQIEATHADLDEIAAKEFPIQKGLAAKSQRAVLHARRLLPA